MVEEFLATLTDKLRFDEAHLSLCTHYSWFGLAKKDRLGLEDIYLFYNRVLGQLSPALLTIEIDDRSRQQSRRDLPLHIEETDGQGFSGRIAFTEPDILCYHARLEEHASASTVRATFALPESDPPFERRVAYDPDSRMLTVRTLVPATDPRDPDLSHAVTICLIVPEGFACAGATSCNKSVQTAQEGLELTTDKALTVTFAADAAPLGTEEHTFILGIGEGPTADKIEARMPRGRIVDFASSLAASEKWLARALDKFTFEGVPEGLRLLYAKAAYQILSNTKAPRGQLARHGVFPARGTYCAHYLWDACFTNLGVAHFNERLASDYLVALCECQEPDGKIPQFACPTWNRPDESQPPLIAWSAWRLYERFGNKELIRDVYGPLCRMVDWWFAKRDDDGDGVVEYQHRLESGWDDSPRFDNGRIAGVDLNSYLNQEMQMLAKMAPVLGRDSESEEWSRRAMEHARLVYARLFDRSDGLFYDRLVAEDRLHKVLTPASFTPLWVGLPVPRDVAHDMIIRYLVNPKHFFGSRPFPVVAYSDRNYKSDTWWRGPVWVNIAWIMVDILHKFGFEREKNEAIRKIIDMMARNDEIYELYSSATGDPLGAVAYCWSSAVFMDLALEMGKNA